jgi:hypothetical protein
MQSTIFISFESISDAWLLLIMLYSLVSIFLICLYFVGW